MESNAGYKFESDEMVQVVEELPAYVAARVPSGPWPWEAPAPPYLGETDTEQFTVESFVSGKSIGHQAVHDPFVCTTVVIGNRDLFFGWLASVFLFRPFRVQVSVRGTHAAQRRIMTMNPVQMIAENLKWEKECAERACRPATEGCTTAQMTSHGGC